MLILSLDTSYSYANFTLFDTEKRIPIITYGEERGRKALEIFPKIFEDLGVDIKSVDAFAVNLGPGYSTGLRVGVSMFKTYAWVSKKPLFTYTSFECFTSFANEEGKYLTVLKVSRYWVYGIWEKTFEGWKELKKPSVLDEEAIEELITLKDLKLIIPFRFEEEFESVEKRIPLIGKIVLPLAGFSEVGAVLAYEKSRRGAAADILKVEPVYFRPPV